MKRLDGIFPLLVVLHMSMTSSCFILGLSVTTAAATTTRRSMRSFGAARGEAAFVMHQQNGSRNNYKKIGYSSYACGRVGCLRAHDNKSYDKYEKDFGIDKEEKEDWLKKCQMGLSAFAAASIFFFSGPTTYSFPSLEMDVSSVQGSTASLLPGSYHSMTALRQSLFRPSAANAIETAEAETANTDLAASSSVLEDESDLPTPAAIGTMSSPDDNSQLSSPSSLQTQQQSKPSTVLDEVWSLVDKYYIDRTFHGQDWNQVKQTYTAKLLASSSSSSSNPQKTISDDKLMKLVTEMVSSLGDKYSRILDAQSYTRIQKFDLIGVGATLMPNGNDKRIMVGAPPVPGSAADKAGIKYGDYITAVNGIPTEGRTAFDIIDQISNDDPNAQTVTMTVLTEGPDDLRGEGYIRDLTLERQFEQVVNPVSYKITEERKDASAPNEITKVGYVRVTEFNSLVERSLRDAFLDLESKNVDAYVLDLRGNPGGAFQSAVEISSLFFEDKVATYVVDSNDVTLPFKTAKGKVVVEQKDPIVVWIDGRSASATEVLAGSLRDNCRAVVMGEPSFGKGLIQAVYGLKNGSGLVLTVARYVTPNGSDIQGKGITPDISGNGIVPPSFVPGLKSDTSRIDFGVVRERLSDRVCKVPDQAVVSGVGDV